MNLETAFGTTDFSKTADFITGNNRASVITRETLDQLTVAVADPTQTNRGSVTVALNRSAAAVSSLDAGVTVAQLSPTIPVSVNLAECSTFRRTVQSNLPGNAYEE